jgi:acetyltransferase
MPAMGVRNLDKIFKPQRIALIGACEESDSLGASVLRNLFRAGFHGAIYPVDPQRESIQGVPTYPDLVSLPRAPDLAVICSPAEKVPAIVQQCGEAGIRGILILSGGFRECGDPGYELERQIAAVSRRFEHLRIVGPNSLGIIGPAFGLNASHAATLPKPGHLAFISQSRALCNSVIDWAADEGIGFSYFVSIGNTLDVGCGDLIDYFGADPNTRAIILYLQSVEHARQFMSAARAFAWSKPIVAYKAGRFAESAHVVASHTGALVAEDAVYEAAFRRAGVVRVTELDDIFDVADLLASQRLPRGTRLAIVGNAGGPAVIATDALLARNGELARLGEGTLAQLNAALPPVGSHANPVDLLDGAPPERYAQAIPIVLADPSVDAVLVIFAAQLGSDPCGTAEALVEAAKPYRKPVLAAWMGGGKVHEGIRILNQAGIPTHGTPEQAVRAFMHLVSYAQNRVSLYETPREIRTHFDVKRHRLRKRLARLLQGRSGTLTEHEAKVLLKAYEIPVCDGRRARSAEEAVEVAERIGYPVVVKVLSPDVVHKVDIGGVALDLQGPDEVRAAYERVVATAEAHLDHVRVESVSVQSMVHVEHGVELILGAKKDPTFGMVVMVGMGGIATGVFRDRAVDLPPLNERLARRMLESLRFWPLLQGYRGRPGVDVDGLIEVMIQFSLLVADLPQIREFDINPLLVSKERIVCLDAAAILESDTTRLLGAASHPHLAIRPYPEEYVRRVRLADGTPATMRSVRPEDEPLWRNLVGSSSPESIRFRFRSLFKQPTHQMAIEHVAIDYERQIAIVAETDVSGERQLIGVAQLASDADHETAEYAVLVPDPWQGKRLGGMLLDYCLELARAWGIRRVVAETDPQNTRMIDSFLKRGFTADVRRDEDVVLLERWLYAAQASPATLPVA